MGSVLNVFGCDNPTRMIYLLGFLGLQLLAASRAANNDPHMIGGRSSMVHMMEWRWDDIAEECERFLGPMGFGAIQTSPANENGIIDRPYFNPKVRRPWYERYQAASYKLVTRSGNEIQFKKMVHRCNKAGVRVYVDVLLNHMTGDISGIGTGGSRFDYSTRNYYGVPYDRSHFNSREKCGTQSGEVENWNDPWQLRNCQLAGLADLDQSNLYVRYKLKEFLDTLIDSGVAGFRIDAAKHMWPEDLKAIFDSLHDLNTEYFPEKSRPFIYQEVIDFGGDQVKATDYTHLGRVMESKYAFNIGNVFRKNNGQLLKYLRNFGEGWNFLNGMDALVFIDNHDNQRGHGAGNFAITLSYFDARLLKMATAFMMAWPYGFTSLISSYFWNRDIQNGKDVNDWVGPPTDDNMNTNSVIINQQGTCDNGWVCEHRWRQIYQMVRFRNVVGVEPMTNWWDNGGNAIAFGRGSKGFIVINNENSPVEQTFKTGLPPGRYCDVISGTLQNSGCTGRTVDVNSDGTARIRVDNSWEDPMIAIHIEAKL